MGLFDTILKKIGLRADTTIDPDLARRIEELNRKQSLPSTEKVQAPTAARRAAERVFAEKREIPVKEVLSLFPFPITQVASTAIRKNPETRGGLFGSAFRLFAGSLARSAIRGGLDKAQEEAQQSIPGIEPRSELAKGLIGEETITPLSTGPVAKTSTRGLERLGVDPEIARKGGILGSAGLALMIDNPFVGGAGKGGKIAKEAAEEVAKKIAKEGGETVAETGSKLFHGTSGGKLKVDDLGNINFTRNADLAKNFGDESISVPMEKFNVKEFTTKEEMFDAAADITTKQKLIDEGVDVLSSGDQQIGINTKKIADLTNKELRPSPKLQKIEDLINDVPPPKKTRKFITSARELLPKANKIAGQYVPRSTDELAMKAKNFIAENFEEAEKLALTGSDETAVAVASELLKKYALDAEAATDPAVATALYDKAAEIANTIAPKLTEQGRAIQAASILGRLTPEGQVRFAAKEIQRFNEKNPLKKIPELTGEQAQRIAKEMRDIEKMENGVDKAIRFQKLQEEIQDMIPSPLIKKITSIWKAGLLTGIKTQGLNLFSNLSHGVSEAIKDVPAALVDNAASLFTGRRTKTLTVRGAGGGVKEGFEKGAQYIKTGFDERNIGAKLDYKRVNFGKGIVAKAFQAYTQTVFRALGASDQPFYYGALSRSLMDQALAQGKNQGLKRKELVENAYKIVENPTEEMIRYGVADATTAVFQNKTKLGDAARQIQKIPGVGEIILPFGRTPSAVAMQIINYSPVGIAKTIIENIGKGKFDQRLFSQGIGRGLTGTAMLAIGTYLAKEGMIALDFPMGDEREEELQKEEGVKNNSIKINGKWRSPTILGPLGNLLLIGGHTQRALEESGSPTEALSMAMLGGISSFTEQTFLTGLQNAVNAVTDPERYAKSYLPNLISSFVPTIVSDVARATDPLERRAENTEQKVKARIPGLRQELEPQVTVLGEERARVGNPLEVMLDPTRPSPVTETPVTNELRRLMDEGFRVSPTKLGTRKGFDGLTQEENTELWKYAGEITNDKLLSLFSKPAYQELSDDKKAKIVEDIVDKSKTNARAAFIIKLTDGLEGEELKSRLSELKESGVLTSEVFTQYKKFR